MDLIDKQPIMKFIVDGLNSGKFGHDAIEVLTELEYAPKVEAVTVVHCRECRHARESEDEFDWDGTHLYRCGYCKLPNRRHEYCSWGERRRE